MVKKIYNILYQNPCVATIVYILYNSFWWGLTKVNNAKIPLAFTVENCVDEPSICRM